MDDDSLVARFRAGEEDAFTHLYRRHREAVYRYALALLGDAALAEDAAQTAFLRAFRALGETEKDIAFRPWLLRITRNVCWDELRRRRVICLPPDELPEEAPRAAGLPQHEEAERRAVARRVRQVLRSLPPRYREALVLRELMGLSYGELAQVLGCSLASVRVLLHRARIHFARKYESAVLTGARRGCRDLAELLSARLDGALDEGTARRVERHVADCPLCREEINRLRRVGELFAFLPLPVLPPSLLEAKPWGGVAPSADGAGAGGAYAGPVGAGATASGFSLGNLVMAAALLGVLAGGGYLLGTPTGRQTLQNWRGATAGLGAGLGAVGAHLPGRAAPLEAAFAGGDGTVAGLAPGQTLTRELTLRNPGDRPVSYRLTVEGTGELFACRPGPAPACDGGPASLRVVRVQEDGGEAEAGGWRSLPPGATERFRILVHLPAAAGQAYRGTAGTLRIHLDQR